jgi:hypothetical protein
VLTPRAKRSRTLERPRRPERMTQSGRGRQVRLSSGIPGRGAILTYAESLAVRYWEALSLASVMGPVGCHEDGTTWLCGQAW